MNRIMKRVLSVLCMCLLASVISGTMVNAAAATNLPDSFLIGDQNGVKVGDDGEYYIDCEDVLPGDVFHKVLTIQNLDLTGMTPESSIPFELTMRMEPVSEIGPVKLLDITQLVLKLDGTVIYSGRVRGDESINAIQNALYLGKYKPGDQRVLDITLTIDGNINQADWEEEAYSEAKFRWIFYAWREKSEDGPKTGFLENYGVYLLPIGGMATLSAVLFFLKTKKKHSEAQGQDAATL